MPFGSYEESPEAAFHNASHVMMETGCQAVKLETGAFAAETISFLTERGVPVMAHVGLRPQSMHIVGGFKLQGRSKAEREAILADARAAEEAGAFAVVLEKVTEATAEAVTEGVGIPTIGIGASAACDGQVLVITDMLGLQDWAPKFAKRYEAFGARMDAAAKAYAADVRAGRFPGPEHVYGPAKT
jgi:3-methyl-2-oxobutanoate hydroxymethyltransferase